MLNPTKTAVMLLVILIAGCATGPSGQSFDSAIGVWNERYEIPNGSPLTSRLTITDESVGIYTHSVRVEFYAIEKQRKWKGYWIHETGEFGAFPSSEEKNGTVFWGEVIYQFNETYNGYTGTWDFCGKDQKFASKGVR